jgi:hypothetical protein
MEKDKHSEDLLDIRILKITINNMKLGSSGFDDDLPDGASITYLNNYPILLDLIIKYHINIIAPIDSEKVSYDSIFEKVVTAIFERSITKKADEMNSLQVHRMYCTMKIKF